MKNWAAWDQQRDSRKGHVWCFDFAANTLRRQSTRQLFARESLNSDDVEKDLNRLIEAPQSQFLSEGGFDDGRALGKGQLEAVALSFLVQPVRALDGVGRTSRAVESLMRMKDEDLRYLAHSFLSKNEVGTFTLQRDLTLFLPETGWYGFPLMEAKPVPVWAHALPVTPRTILFAIPKGFDFRASDLNIACLANFSVGMGRINRLVVSAATVATHGEVALVNELPKMRADAEAVRDRFMRIRSQIDTAFESVGLSPYPITADLGLG